MMQTKSFARYAALIVGVLVASSCDTRLPTQVSGADDIERPVVTFSAAGAVNNAVALGAPVLVTVKVSDNIGVSTLLTTVRDGATVIAIDTATFKPVTASTSRVVTVPLTNAKKGDRIVVRSTVTDGALNTRTDSLVLTIAAPAITLLTPLPGSNLNVGDSLLVTARVKDGAGLNRITFFGYSLRGSAALGTQDTVRRYPLIAAPATGSFVVGTTDTVITRYLKASLPADSLTDSLYVVVVAVDALGGIDTARVSVKVVRGPSLQVLSPVPGDSATAGAGLTIILRATDQTGVSKLGFRVTSDASFPTRVDTTVIARYGTFPKDVTFSATIQVPTNAPPKGILTITPLDTNSGGQEGASPRTLIAVRAGQPPSPRVFQSIAKRVETVDSLTVTAIGNGITYVGYILRDSAGGQIRRDSVALTTPFPSTVVRTVSLNLPDSLRGKRITLTSFAYDQGGRIGYSLPAGATTSQGILGNAFRDTTLVVYGRTFALPSDRSGVIGDIVVDSTGKNVFLSNIGFGRLEVWHNSDSTFDAVGIPVASQPWGMTMSITEPSTIYVGNSGGTSISRVITTPGAMREDLQRRIKTRPSFVFTVSESKDETGKIRFFVNGPFQYSDRLQYIAQASSGRLYFSTKPTSVATKGTVRYLDEKSGPAPDMRFMLNYASRTTDQKTYTIINVDDVRIGSAKSTSSSSDTLYIYDHPSGDSTNASPLVGIDTTVVGAIAQLRSARGASGRVSDVEYDTGIDPETIGLTDTTFVASSGNHDWIAFGEGHSAPGSRVVLYKDTDSTARKYSASSPGVLVRGLSNNASDVVYGLALDKTGNSLAVHGVETFFALVDDPFQLRLQGKKSTFNVGAGVAFNPDAQGVSTPDAADRLAYVASANGTIEIVDAAYYDFARGLLPTKSNLYGPLRAVKNLRGPGIVTLFGLSSQGLVVVDVRPSDVKPGP